MLHLDAPTYIACADCGNKLLSDFYLNSNNKFFLYGKVPICNGCLKQYILNGLRYEEKGNWTFINKICQKSN